MTEEAQKIQALLFVAGEAVPNSELAKLAGISVDEVGAYVQEISDALAGHGLAIVNTQAHTQITTAPAVADYLAEFQSKEIGKLTKAAAETLALIAYRGPLSRYDIDIIRGVDSRGIIRSLVRRGVIRQIQKAGRTPMYDITEDFLLHLGVTRREELPDYESLHTTEAVEKLLQEDEDV